MNGKKCKCGMDKFLVECPMCNTTFYSKKVEGLRERIDELEDIISKASKSVYHNDIVTVNILKEGVKK